MLGFAGPTLADVLRAMRKAVRLEKRLREKHGDELPAGTLNTLSLLLRWEHKLLKGRLKVTGPHTNGSSRYYKVAEVKL